WAIGEVQPEPPRVHAPPVRRQTGTRKYGQAEFPAGAVLPAVAGTASAPAARVAFAAGLLPVAAGLAARRHGRRADARGDVCGQAFRFGHSTADAGRQSPALPVCF